MSWDFFTNSTAPWWATVALPIVTLLVGQTFTSRTAREQRKDEIQAAADLRRDEAASLAAERDREYAAIEADRRAAVEEAKEARFNGIFNSAMDAIHALQAELTAYSGTGKMNDDAVRQVAVALGHVRVDILQGQEMQYSAILGHENFDTFNPEWIIKEAIQVRTEGLGALALAERLSNLANVLFELRKYAAGAREAEGS